MKCNECTLWRQHESGRQELEKGSCMNIQFAGVRYCSPQITLPETRCASGIRKKK